MTAKLPANTPMPQPGVKGRLHKESAPLSLKNTIQRLHITDPHTHCLQLGHIAQLAENQAVKHSVYSG